ncbi:MAG: aminotransferase class I/II-fold pyridoxal phosphate-dependent enzyme [Clostridia bacterium]|nr:aminotransferase class I/II-fold pyridoxal phosphate-dependent enzyme [Clostridia bacterium]
MQYEFLAKRLENIHSDIRGPIYYRALEMEANGEKILKLNTGNPAAFGFKMPESVKDCITENVEKSLGYCDIRGMLSAKEAIVEYETKKGIQDITVNDVFVTNGVSEAANLLTSALVDAGDEVLMPNPCYSLWSNSVLASGGIPVYYDCLEEDNWNPDIEDIKSKVSKRTKAIVVINPNNPTGVLYPNNILLEIAEIARKNNIVVFSDEIYDRLVFDGKTHTSFAKLASDIPVVTLNGLSKSHCLCGLRSGWIVLSGKCKIIEELNRALVVLASVRLCSNALMQLVIPTALKDTEYTNQMISPSGRLYLQREACAEAISQIEGLSCVKNDGAFYIFPKIDTERYNVTDDKAFARGLLETKKILIVAGSGFGFKTPDHFRVVMLPEHQTLKNAMFEIGDYLQTLKK